MVTRTDNSGEKQGVAAQRGPGGAGVRNVRSIQRRPGCRSGGERCKPGGPNAVPV